MKVFNVQSMINRSWIYTHAVGRKEIGITVSSIEELYSVPLLNLGGAFNLKSSVFGEKLQFKISMSLRK